MEIGYLGNSTIENRDLLIESQIFCLIINKRKKSHGEQCIIILPPMFLFYHKIISIRKHIIFLSIISTYKEFEKISMHDKLYI